MSETQIILAPAAGSGIGKKLADKLLEDEAKFVADMAGVVERGMNATRKQWDHGAKCWVEEPDTKTQIQTLALVLAHMEGEPVKRIIHQHLGAGGKLDLAGALQESPELAQAVEKELQKARWKHSGRQDHKRPVKAVEAVEDAEGAKPSVL